ncbi:MAG: hypothetical protein LPJ98_05710 [Cyclobacteriaceae bacterium]|nr:hypothetical protein [Cyclobacteriaceae bacterium]
MKKSILLLFAFLVFGFAYAQEQGDVRIQVGPDYKLNINDIGAHAGVEYVFVDNLSIAPSFTYWFPDFGRSSNLNMDLRYYLTKGVSQVYVMGGYSNIWLNTQPGLPGQTLSRSGGNFGLGAFLDIAESFGINTEFKIQSQNTRQPVLRLGLVFKVGS